MLTLGSEASGLPICYTETYILKLKKTAIALDITRGYEETCYFILWQDQILGALKKLTTWRIFGPKIIQKLGKKKFAMKSFMYTTACQI
jgi:hypothetical protein